jgi:hypothetical protein
VITTPSGGTASNLLTGVAYAASGQATGASVAGGIYTYGASYDLDTRLSSLSVKNASSNVTLFGTAR